MNVCVHQVEFLLHAVCSWDKCNVVTEDNWMRFLEAGRVDKLTGWLIYPLTLHTMLWLHASLFSDNRDCPVSEDSGWTYWNGGWTGQGSRKRKNEGIYIYIFISNAQVIYELYELDLLSCIIWQAIGARNLLKSVAKQREAQQQQLQALIAEKRMQLERFTHVYYVLVSCSSCT